MAAPAEHQRRDLLRLQRPRRPRLRAEAGEPVGGIRVRHRGGDALPDRGVAADALERQVGIGRIPEPGRVLLPPRPAAQPVAIPRAEPEQVARAREAARVAPDRGDALALPLDEDLDVALPRSGVVGPEAELVGARQQHPAREVDDAHGAEEAGAVHARVLVRDQPERGAQRHAPEQPGLHGRDRGEQVLRVHALPRHDRPDFRGVGRVVVRRVGRLQPMQIAQRQPSSGGPQRGRDRERDDEADHDPGEHRDPAGAGQHEGREPAEDDPEHERHDEERPEQRPHRPRQQRQEVQHARTRGPPVPGRGAAPARPRTPIAAHRRRGSGRAPRSASPAAWPARTGFRPWRRCARPARAPGGCA